LLSNVLVVHPAAALLQAGALTAICTAELRLAAPGPACRLWAGAG
jgi:hypothetical protein